MLKNYFFVTIFINLIFNIFFFFQYFFFLKTLLFAKETIFLIFFAYVKRDRFTRKKKFPTKPWTQLKSSVATEKGFFKAMERPKWYQPSFFSRKRAKDE